MSTTGRQLPSRSLPVCNVATLAGESFSVSTALNSYANKRSPGRG